MSEGKKDCFWLPLNKHAMNEYLYLNINKCKLAYYTQSAPKLENRENISMFSTCSELTPRAPIPDGRMAQFMQPCLSMWAIWGSQQPFSCVFQVFTVDQIRPILQFFYFWSDMIFKLIDRWSEMILTTDVRPWPPRFTLISPNWLLICALTVFEIKIDF